MDINFGPFRLSGPFQWDTIVLGRFNPFDLALKHLLIHLKCYGAGKRKREKKISKYTRESVYECFVLNKFRFVGRN